MSKKKNNTARVIETSKEKIIPIEGEAENTDTTENENPPAEVAEEKNGLIPTIVGKVTTGFAKNRGKIALIGGIAIGLTTAIAGMFFNRSAMDEYAIDSYYRDLENEESSDEEKTEESTED